MWRNECTKESKAIGGSRCKCEESVTDAVGTVLLEESWRRRGGLYQNRAEPRPAADCLQRPLRSRFRQQLRRGVRPTKKSKAGCSSVVW
jgi:hypothetical protein